MKVLFHLGHPAHFHLFKNSMHHLKEKGVEVIIAIKKKDVLEDLLINSSFDYINILPQGKKSGKINLFLTQFEQIKQIIKLARKEKVNLLCGTSASIGIAGKFLKIPNFNFNEDDAEAVPLYAKMAYPFATKIVAPSCCSVGKYKKKKVAYESYHELAYLHPENFSASKEIAQKYFNLEEKNFILRFAELNAHHDKGINGISDKFAFEIIEILENYGNVFITSEKPLPADFEKYRLAINPMEMHHVLACAEVLIADSQTMCAEAACLGVPFIRHNDFVGKLSYLKELEEKYKLGFGYNSKEKEQLKNQLRTLLKEENLKEIFKERKKTMLADKIPLNIFINQEILKLR
jgi:hypothetical protein